MKGLYAPLREDGYTIDIAEHTAEAVRCVLQRHYDVIILDSRDIGLKASEASSIIRKIDPEVYIVLIGDNEGYEYSEDILVIDRPVSLDSIKMILKDFIERYTNNKKGGIYDTERDHLKSI